MKSLQGGHGVRNKFTKQACITLAIGVMIASAVGCSTKSNSEQNVPAQNEQTQNRQPENMGSKTQQPREEATISLGRVVGGDTKFKNGETIEDNVHTRWAKKKFNINFKVDWTVGTGDAFTSKLRLLLNSGEKLPDVFTLNDPALEKQMVDSGKVMDITEAFDKYASPRIKELYDKYPEIWNTATYDGKHYGLPAFNAVSSFSVLWIRQDWLDKLGLQAPKTIDEMENVMDAFVNRDPDGNGVKKNPLLFQQSISESSWQLAFGIPEQDFTGIN